MGVFKIVGVILVLLLCHPACLLGVTIWHIYPGNDLNGLQSLWRAWNTTPDPGLNLLNWYTPTEPNDTAYPCYHDRNWRGVTCLRYRFNATQWDTWVIGLELDDASILGTLPAGINQLSTLASLKLTRNHNLSGNLPKELADIPLNILDLHGNGFNGTIPQEILNMNSLLELDLSGNEFTGPFPKFNYTFLTLSYLNLSRNSFSELPGLSQIFNSWFPPNVRILDLSGLDIGGALPANWSAYPDLLSRKELYLDDINISGVLNITSILSGIENLLPTVSPLNVLSLKNNRITDVIFDKGFLISSLFSSVNIKFYLEGNPYCKTVSADADGRRCFCEQYCAITVHPKKIDYKAIIIPTVISGVVLLTVIFCLAIIIHLKNKHMHTLVKRFEESDVRAKRYDYHELRAATKNFSEERKLGQGGYGTVYKGILTNNAQVAVKKLSMKTEQAGEEFLNEVLLITNLQHRNLVALKGYCLHGFI